MAIVEVAIIPMGTGNTSVSKYVADCHKILEEQKSVKSLLTPMGSILEGDLDLIFQEIRKMHEVPFASGAMRVSTTIRIDDRRDKDASIEQKIKSVEEKM
ncbi:MAG: MTH1187 family thiamine-binding protein [Syntrophomonas sp.]|nr:MTH1187 family thiamine-binding protein [Syntrophomonas sp.]